MDSLYYLQQPNTLKRKPFFVRYFAYLPSQNYTASISTVCVTIHTKYSIGKHASFTFFFT